MLQQVNQGNVRWVCDTVIQVLGDGRFNQGEVVIGLSEALGRVIVDLCDTPVSGAQAAQVMLDHIKATLDAGFRAKGFNMGAIEQ